jgi:hypothetical protein
MHSSEEELRELTAEGVLDRVAAARAVAIERRTVFSLFEELRAALYAAVVLVVTGVGILLKEHLDRIGPLTLILVLALGAVACYFPAIRAQSHGAPRSTGVDYLLLLGALIVSADFGYAESQFHWVGASWSRYLIFLAALHAYTAYALNSRLVLSVALATLAAWFGIERGPAMLAGSHSTSTEIGVRALLCATAILGWRAIDQRVNAARFREVFEHFAANLAFCGALSWCADERLRVVGVLVLLLLSAVAIHKALRSGTMSFAVYGVGYAALGLSLVTVQVTGLTLLGATLVLGIVLTAAAILRRLHDLLKDERP